MNPEVEAVFVEADSLPPEERTRFLDRACADNQPLREEVENLLGAAEGADSYFDAFSDRIGVSPGAAAGPPETIGVYRVIRLIGEGGMGTVFLAERSDQQFEKQVAIKVLPHRFVGPAARRRFLAERQILAQLVHPHICRLLDGGITHDGVPYFVMDYVPGMELDKYCDQNKLDLNARLDLFCQICSAVSYAHRNLIIHRDLKPGNVLVTPTGEAQLLDFGIAKIQEEGAPDTDQTAVGQRALTPLYASPEMISGDPVNTASDIYSLGILLYVLMTGCQPRQIQTDGGRPTMQAIRNAPLVRASVRIEGLRRDFPDQASHISRVRQVSATQLRGRLEGDLDLILAKAMEEEPEKRYSTVEALVADIRCHQQNLPIQARAPSTWYRLRKLIRRRRALVGALALSAVLLVGAVLMASWFAISTAQQSRQIAAERDRAENIKEFLLGLFDQAHPNAAKGETIGPEQLVEIGASRARKALGDQPETLADVLSAVSQIYVVLGRYELALPVLRDVVELREQTSGEASAETASALDSLSELIEIQGDYDLAESLQQRAVGIRRQIGEPVGLAQSLTRFGRVQHLRGELDTAQAYYREGLMLYREALGERSQSVAESLVHLGALQMHQGRHEDAERSQTEALGIWSTLYGEDHLKVIESHIQLAATKNAQQQFDEALQHSEIALAGNTKLLGADHRDNMYITNGMGIALLKLGRFEAAQARLQQTLDIMGKNLEPGHPNYAFVYANLGKLNVERGDFGAAVGEFRRSRQIFEERLPGHWATFDVLSRLGRALSEVGQHAEAESLLLEGFEGLKSHWGVNDDRTREAVLGLIRYFDSRGLPDRAETYRALIESPSV